MLYSLLKGVGPDMASPQPSKPFIKQLPFSRLWVANCQGSVVAELDAQYLVVNTEASYAAAFMKVPLHERRYVGFSTGMISN